MRRLVVVCAVVFVVAGLVASPALAEGSAPSKGSPAAGTTAAGNQCTLRPSAHLSGKNEWASCIGVDATLSRAPTVGQTAVLTVSVKASAPRTARISIELPSNLAFVGAPAGMNVARATSFADAAQRVTAASATRSIATGATVTYRATVKAVATGRAAIRARALARVSAGRTDGGSDAVYLSIGRTSSTMDAATSAAKVQATGRVPAGVTIRPVTSRPYEAVSTSGSRPASQVSAAYAKAHPNVTACATGFWSYQDQNANWHPSMNIQVQAWDQNSAWPNSEKAVGVTDGNGHYSLCFDNGETGPFDSGTADIYILFITENTDWRVRDTPGGNNDYVWQTGTFFDITPSGHDFGSLTSGDASLMPGLHAFDEANQAWLTVQGQPGANGCFDPLDSSCRQLVINWTSTSSDGTYYSPGGNDVHLAAVDPNSQIQTTHEIGHAVMDDVYDDAFPPAPNCNPHSIPAAQSAGCGWTEGWATYFADWVWNDNAYRWPDGSVQDEEGPTWGTPGWANGDWPEGRTTGFLLDLKDSTNEAPYDRANEGPNPIWYILTHYISNTLNDFWVDRAAAGYDTSFNGPSAAALYQNTVDYGYRDPLGDYASALRNSPPKQSPVPAGSSNDHHYSFNTSTNYWSVVAVRPASTADYDLYLYDDYGEGSLLASSAYGAGTVDFVAVDSNRRTLGDYYPRVYNYNGANTAYQIELAQGASLGGPRNGQKVKPFVGTQVVSMGSAEVVAVRDTLQSAGVPVYVKLVPSNGGQDGAIFLMQDDPGNSGTWVQGRSSAVAASDSLGAGGTEQLSYTPGFSEYEGLVILNKAGSGTYTLYVDNSAPAGSVTINGGATYTTSANVSLGLSASDAETGIDAMRISTDGVMDSEPWIPYSGSASATLPSGDGTKTVLAQFRNNAGMTSSVVSDTIVLDTTAPIVTKKPVIAFVGKKTLDGSFAIPTKVTWKATDANGVASYQLQESVDGGAFTDVPLGNPSVAKTTLNLAAGHSYRFQVRAIDNAGNTSAYALGTPSTISAYDENAGAITYSNGWTRVALAGTYGGQVEYSTAAGKTATFAFSGSQVALVTVVGPDRGVATASLDGAAAKNVNTHAAHQTILKVMYVQKAKAGAHSLLLTNLGTSGHSRFDIDVLFVIS